MDDPDVVLACDHGDADAFGRLVERYAGALKALAKSKLNGDEQAAEDAVQEAFMDAWARISLLRDPSSFGAWLYKIVQAQCVQNIRSNQIERHFIARSVVESGSVDSEEDVATPVTLERMMTDERNSQLRAAVDLLSEPLRDAVTIRYLSETSRRDSAAILGISLEALDKRLERALKELRRHWKEE